MVLLNVFASSRRWTGERNELNYLQICYKWSIMVNVYQQKHVFNFLVGAVDLIDELMSANGKFHNTYVN